MIVQADPGRFANKTKVAGTGSANGLAAHRITEECLPEASDNSPASPVSRGFSKDQANSPRPLRLNSYYHTTS